MLSEWFRWQELGGEADGSNLEIVTKAEPFKQRPRCAIMTRPLHTPSFCLPQRKNMAGGTIKSKINRNFAAGLLSITKRL
ncbi:MAG: hypothetical protein DBX47_06860 [Clostridiales bacterium]|nr:MAG: hypothetical protein DBX47_06860 [Clostridiales bacterium]